MAFEASNWNVVILGAWNRAILTPAWLATTLFGIPEGDPITVELPLDFRGPWRLKAEELSIMVGNQGLEIGLDRPAFELLPKACLLGFKAIDALPKTPIVAVGINFRYTYQEPPIELASLGESKLDAFLSDAGFEIKDRSIKRSLAFADGLINLDLTYTTSETQLLFNFHRATSDVDGIKNWLSQSIGPIQDKVNNLLQIIQGEA